MEHDHPIKEETQDASCHTTEEATPSSRWRAGTWREFVLVLLVLVAVLGAASFAAYLRRPTAPSYVELGPGATVYYNEACSDCAVYLAGVLRPGLEAAGIAPIVVKDYINVPEYREELRALNDEYGIPFTLQSHLATFVKGTTLTVLEGHVPDVLIWDSLATANRTARLLIAQDSMGTASSYRAWAFAGPDLEYSVDTPVSTYLEWFVANVAPANGATVFYENVGPECAAYVREVLQPGLIAAGVSPLVVRDVGADPAARDELAGFHEAFGVPAALRDHMTTIVSVGHLAALTVLEGHVPASLIEEALTTGNRTERILIHRDSMETGTTYDAWAFVGDAQAYPIQTSLSAFATWSRGNLAEPPPADTLLPLVLATGFVDGLNPCAFAVLLFFVSLLYVTRRPRMELLRIGGLYIFAVFLAYFLIGLGLIAAIMISSDPHFIARVSGVVVAGLGVFTLIQPHLPGIPNPFHTPGFAWERIRTWMFKGTQPAAAVAGFLVGLCTFPCSGGIYVATLSLLAAKTTYWGGLGYLYLYNLAFVLPLVVILAVVSNRQVARTATKWERGHTGLIRQVAGVAMIVVGLLTLVLA